MHGTALPPPYLYTLTEFFSPMWITTIHGKYPQIPCSNNQGKQMDVKAKMLSWLWSESSLLLFSLDFPGRRDTDFCINLSQATHFKVLQVVLLKSCHSSWVKSPFFHLALGYLMSAWLRDPLGWKPLSYLSVIQFSPRILLTKFIHSYSEVGEGIKLRQTIAWALSVNLLHFKCLCQTILGELCICSIYIPQFHDL